MDETYARRTANPGVPTVHTSCRSASTTNVGPGSQARTTKPGRFTVHARRTTTPGAGAILRPDAKHDHVEWGPEGMVVAWRTDSTIGGR